MVGGGTSQTNMTDTVIGNCHLKSPRAYLILSTNCSMIRYHDTRSAKQRKAFLAKKLTELAARRKQANTKKH